MLDENRNEFSGKSGDASSSFLNRTDPAMNSSALCLVVFHPDRQKSLLRALNRGLMIRTALVLRFKSDQILQLQKYLRYSVHLYLPRALFDFVAVGFRALPSCILTCPKQAYSL